MNANALSAMTGLPSGKKTHRGRRSRGKGPKASSHSQHLDGIKSSLASGDNQGAKLHALRLVNALHRTQKETPAAMQVDAGMSGDPMKGY